MLYHPDPSHFIAKTYDYGAMGKALVALSNLEFAHDEFAFKMHSTHRDLSIALAPQFPRHFKAKTDFLINYVANIYELRQIPIFQTGELNLLWLMYQLDELYEIRSIIAHGSIFLSETTPDRITWTFERYVQSRKKTWTKEAVQMSNGYLASVDYTANAIRHYINSLIRCLEGSSSWEKNYQADKEIRRNRVHLARLLDAGFILDDKGWFKAFPPIGPVE
ncbi:MAG: hypothetical protein K9G43_05580 [Rhodobacteraceae bacterium]|nr:hypothetical protein [Paracoccaceae bacterium]